MGKHSAGDGGLGGAGGFPEGIGGAGLPGEPGRRPGGALGTPGTGRRRRAGSVDDTGGFAAMAPRTAGGSPQAHPEHREHSAWGASAGWSGQVLGMPGRSHGSAMDPVEEWAADWAPYDTAQVMRPGATGHAAARVTPGPGPRLVPRPRQEFVDAFDAPPPVPAARRRSVGAPGGTAPEDTDAGPVARPGGTDRTGGTDGSGGTGGRPGSGRGRTITGLAAAAVVTVLAAVIGHQVAVDKRQHGEPEVGPSADGPGRSAPDEASRSQDRAAAPAVTAAVTTPTYADLMARPYHLDPHLRLSGAFSTVPGHQAAPGKGTVVRFRVDVEQGLPLDAKLFSDAVFTTLNDPRSWGHGGAMTFERVSDGPADIVLTLASPGTTAAWCAKSGLDTSVENVSCDAASTPRTMINAYRWAQGAVTYGPTRMLEYRQMLINHEVGHRLGHDHTGCPAPGALAPVMMQQTKFLSLDGGPTCRPNPWPYP